MLGWVRRILLTGMSGTGKSTVIGELAARGYKAIDLDNDAWCAWQPSPAGDGVRDRLDWVWREDRIAQLLASNDADVLFVSGSAPNQVKFHALFDHIVLLSAPANVTLVYPEETPDEDLLRERASTQCGVVSEFRRRRFTETTGTTFIILRRFPLAAKGSDPAARSLRRPIATSPDRYVAWEPLRVRRAR